MQLDTTAKFESVTSSRKKITIGNDDLKQLQRRFALATVLIPFLGSVLAIGLLWRSGIGAVEVALLISMYALTIIGITVGFHRHFAHCAFKTNIAVRIIFAILGSMAAQGPVIHWVSNHRRHHQYSDQSGDPHSPHLYEGIRGLWHGHIGWMLNSEVTNAAVFAKDLLRDSAIAKVNQLYLTWVILGLAIPGVLGGVVTGTWMGAWQGFLWGGLVRIFLAHHVTWSINSITHLYGSRPFDTSEQSTNNLWLAIPSFGEAWHNNHHAFPNSGKFGLQWWEIDLGYWIIRTLEFAGLVWEVKTPTAGMIEAKKAA
ncbi:acyl-CoA desaturase [Moorena producens PAL-8-15-08-1]|uniref:Acyl-CoA desaturase n=1 Tax=Moorena producens PAL-8-15-08-1 TaxID=1458985 RepID=A0A1D8TWF1_9CYAN|nr:acyl-CoA desaturase [Moorena producens]AOX01786.1 acyl-CoA desaturase [Moorena producens PAL-8-15-08-1]